MTSFLVSRVVYKLWFTSWCWLSIGASFQATVCVCLRGVKATKIGKCITGLYGCLFAFKWVGYRAIRMEKVWVLRWRRAHVRQKQKNCRRSRTARPHVAMAQQMNEWRRYRRSGVSANTHTCSSFFMCVFPYLPSFSLSPEGWGTRKTKASRVVLVKINMVGFPAHIPMNFTLYVKLLCHGVLRMACPLFYYFFF